MAVGIKGYDDHTVTEAPLDDLGAYSMFEAVKVGIPLRCSLICASAGLRL
jgi:hypothetical protein